MNIEKKELKFIDKTLVDIEKDILLKKRDEKVGKDLLVQMNIEIETTYFYFSVSVHKYIYPYLGQ